MGAFALPLALAAVAGAGVAATRRGGDPTSRTVRTTSPQSLVTAPTGITGTATPRQRTDRRQRTPGATETGRTAVQRERELRTDARRPGPGATKVGETGATPPDASKDAANAAGAAVAAGKRIKRKFATRRPGSVLTGSVIPAELSPRTLLGY
jgi:hypothetical protein